PPSRFIQTKGMKIDLGCLAKGYSADKVAQFLRKEG
ncbi:FAD:protein FMN transferase, partial [Streptococcus pneumoniae]